MEKEPNHILFLPRWYPNKYDPMWGLFVQKHAAAVSLLNKVSILYLHPIDEGLNETEFVWTSNDQIDTLYIYYPKPKNRILYFIQFIKLYLKGLRMIQKSKRVDIIHVHILSRMGFLAWMTSHIYGIPYVITEHWSRYLPTVNIYRGWLRKRLTERIVKNAEAVMPVTANLREAMLTHKLKNSNYQIVPNVVDDEFFQTPLNTIESSTKRIIHVSTFEDKSKNISGIVQAVKKISQQRNDFKMIFVGDGMDYERIKKMVRDLQLDEIVEFTGLLGKEDLVNEFAKSHFLLINSNYENMPVVINEAMACGLPVLSTDVGGISEHVDHKKGYLFKVGDPYLLVESLNKMLDLFPEFDSKYIKDYAQKHFSFAAVGEAIDHVYRQIKNS
jgi:glycosyltransferase involved in cell wall biosynthesis